MNRFFVIAALASVRLCADSPYKPAFVCTAQEIQWAGLTCSEQDQCPIYLEIASVYGSGEKLLAAGNIHSRESTLYSILLESVDGGRTWREPVARTRGAELDGIQFLNGSRGWISGQRVFPNSGDPFFLITADGGQGWRKSDVLAEGSDGFIQKFWFNSEREGSLALDRGGSDGEQMRYARYETVTGGESWSVRETSDKPIPLKIPAAEQPVWRARGDAAQKALIIEKREGSMWTRVAALALELARCTGEL